MASDNSGSSRPPQGPLGITLPEWMKRKTPDRYAFDETPFSPPSPADEYFLIKYPFRGDAEKKSSYDTIDSLTRHRRDTGSADAIAPSSNSTSPTTTPPVSAAPFSPFHSSSAAVASTASASGSAGGLTVEPSKQRRNSAVTVLPGGQVSIKTYGQEVVAEPIKKSSDPGTYRDFKFEIPKSLTRTDQEIPLSGHELSDDAYDSDCSVSSSNAGAGFASSILGVIGHHLPTGHHSIRDYLGSSVVGPSVGSEAADVGAAGEIHQHQITGFDGKHVAERQRIGLGYGQGAIATANPFFTNGSTMSYFSGLYNKDGTLARKDQHDSKVATSSGGGGISGGGGGAFTSNRSSSSYDSQLAGGMESVSSDRNRQRWVPKPSKQRELNLFAPCST